MEISKELLSEVLSIKVFTEISENDYGKNNILVYWEFDGYHNHCRNINIYELAKKCKEWAYTNKYRLSSGQHRLNTKQEHYINNQIASYFCSVYYITNDDSDIQIDANTEPEAIIKACEWILEQNK